MSTPGHYGTRSEKEIVHVPTRAEAREVAATKNRECVLDRGDLGMMTEIVAEIDGYAERAEKAAHRVRELRSELSSFLEFLRLQLP